MDTTRYNEDDFTGFLQELIDSNQLEPMQKGITKLVIDKGYDALSFKQKTVFDYMVEEYTNDVCERCGVEIPWCEMLDTLDNGGYCNYCKHMLEKNEKE